MVKMGKGLLLEFENPKEAEWVLNNGSKIFRGKYLHLKRWSHGIGCAENLEKVREVWVRVMGLPVHLWSHIGNGCGGFVAVDEGTTFFYEL